jgi:hypothetical protein
MDPVAAGMANTAPAGTVSKATCYRVWTKKLEDVERIWRKRLEQSGTECSHKVEAMHAQAQQDKVAPAPWIHTSCMWLGCCYSGVCIRAIALHSADTQHGIPCKGEQSCMGAGMLLVMVGWIRSGSDSCWQHLPSRIHHQSATKPPPMVGSISSTRTPCYWYMNTLLCCAATNWRPVMQDACYSVVVAKQALASIAASWPAGHACITTSHTMGPARWGAGGLASCRRGERAQVAAQGGGRAQALPGSRPRARAALGAQV